MIIELAILLIVSFGTAFFSAPFFIKRLVEKGFVVKDMYKAERPDVPTMGGLIILTGIFASLITAQLLFPDLARNLLIFYFVVLTFAFFGLVDDLLYIEKKTKILLPYFLALPIALLNMDTSISLGFISLELGLLYSLFIAPVYVMVVMNLVNMHSGYNGLAVGLTNILYVAVAIGALIKNGAESLIFVLPVLGGSLALYYYNRYPSKVFDGNIGSSLMGSALGGLLVLNNLELFGIIILSPHIINFLMYVYLKATRMKEVKFGKINGDGTLDIPHPVCLKWTLPYYMRMTERTGTFAMFALTFFSALLGIGLFH